MKFKEAGLLFVVAILVWPTLSPKVIGLLRTKTLNNNSELKTSFISDNSITDGRPSDNSISDGRPNTPKAPAPSRVNPSAIDMFADDLPSGTVLEIQQRGKIYRWNSRYADSNKNRTVDAADAGYFPPASNIKVAIAALAVEKNGGIGGIERDIQLALIVSDNAAANRLIDKAGGVTAITRSLSKKGFKNFIVTRKFGSAPRGKGVCMEGPGEGNCATASDLIKSLRLLQPGGTAFNISEADLKFLRKTMRLTPADIGVKKANDYCRFLPGINQQKCGVAIASRHYSGLGIVGNSYVFISVRPPNGITDAQIIRGIHRIVNKKLSEIK